MRRKTTVVKIGNLTVASEQPVMIQSMLNTSTMDTVASVEQAIRIIEAGGQLVRITAQGVKEAENLKAIHAGLREKGYETPLSADIHFNPEAALVAAKYVEKVRINPGNFVDKRAVFKTVTYTDEQYAAELKHLREKFLAFLDVCRQHHTAVRIGTNHGSLSDRIMSRYGNTPAGMVEATMEYLRVCRETDFRDVVISLKSSDCRVMVEAVRLLVKEMEKEGINYPLHLGVTEAGEGEDGRIRSAVGIGCLLNEGIGDTIRVSLTEAPEKEIPVAKTLVAVCDPEWGIQKLQKRTTVKPWLVADMGAATIVDEKLMAALDFREDSLPDPVLGVRLKAGSKAPELIYTEALGPELTKLPEETVVVVPAANIYMAHVYNRRACPFYTAEEFLRLQGPEKEKYNYLFVELKRPEELRETLLKGLASVENAVVVLSPEKVNYHMFRKMLYLLQAAGSRHKVIIRAYFGEEPEEIGKIRIAAHTGGLFIDSLADGLWITGATAHGLQQAFLLGQNILQSVGVRRYKTEFVSCPGCGRTLYNLEDAVAKVKAAFSHLDNLKIAVMGCIVNGPGEMGDADYGYVGAGNGKVNLYKGRERVKVAVPEQQAIETLRRLMMENGDWKER